MAKADAIIRIDAVSKRFASATAVDDVSLDVMRGEFFSLLGPSGCGKTTLLRMIAGFETPSEGEIYIDGQPCAQVPPNKRPTNMVFQSYAIFPHLNVADNIAYGLRRLNLSGGETRRRVEEALAMIQLTGLGQRRADQLSGGQRQRVALARALILRPKVLLLDEPLGALDKKLREEMQLELRALQRRLGITFIFVTHDQEEALSMSDRIAVMFRGKVAQVSNPEGLYESPGTVDVASFIGSVNLIAARVKSVQGQTITAETEGLGPVEAQMTPGGTPPVAGSGIRIAIRPEKLYLSKTKPQGHCVQGTMGAAAYLGDRSHYQVMLPGRGQPLSVSATNVTRTGDHQLSAGTPVFLSWAPTSLIVFAA